MGRDARPRRAPFHAGRPGNSDWLRVCRGYPGGLVAVYAPELTREAIWDALWHRRCYATTGKRIILEFSVDGEPMGSLIRGNAFQGVERCQWCGPAKDGSPNSMILDYTGFCPRCGKNALGEKRDEFSEESLKHFMRR